MFFSIFFFIEIFQAHGQDCEMIENEFCEMIENETSHDVVYFGCNDLNAELLPHPEYCTLFIHCDGNETRTSTTGCCALGDTDGDGCPDERLWFNPLTNECDFPNNFDNTTTTCKLPVANITTTTTTATTTNTTTITSTTTTTTTSTTTITTPATTTSALSTQTTTLTTTTMPSTATTSTSSTETTTSNSPITATPACLDTDVQTSVVIGATIGFAASIGGVIAGICLQVKFNLASKLGKSLSKDSNSIYSFKPSETYGNVEIQDNKKRSSVV